MVRKISGHMTKIREYGDGFHEPHEVSIDCECGAHIWDWQQYYQEAPDWEQDWLDHLTSVEHVIVPTPIYRGIEDNYKFVYSRLNQELTNFGRIDCSIPTGGNQ